MDPDFANRVTAQTERLSSMDSRAIARQVAQERIAWLQQCNHSRPPGWPLPQTPVSPRRAYELLFFEYMGLNPEDLPVTVDSDSRIEWLSSNPCPTLEACSHLDLDTRNVCRSIHEKPTQIFLSELDPRLRFVRDYSTIRPYAPHCREGIVQLDLDELMREAIREAQTAKSEGNKGYGALVVLGARVITRTHDTAVTERDPSRHAEFKAIHQAVVALGTADLCGALLLTTCEPCPMCTGLAVWANVTTIVYGSAIADTAAMGRTRVNVGAQEIADQAPNIVEVIGGVLKDECDRLYASSP